MKTRILLISILAIAFGISSCSHHHYTHLPPGQAKKLSGSKSAKPYAPGQQKKYKH